MESSNKAEEDETILPQDEEPITLQESIEAFNEWFYQDECESC
jgi:hypothetical protein